MSTIGTIEVIAKIDTSQYRKGAADIKDANKSIEGSAESTANKSNAVFTGIAKVGLAAVAAAAVAVGVAISKNIGNAVKRVDTLNNFPKVMENLGYGVDESSAALKKLDQGVRGLPTSLDNIASAMQNIAPSSRSLDEATKLTLALNNALIAGGKDVGLQATAMEQFSQAIAKGKPDMMEWRSLATAMPGQLDQISKSLNFKNWQEMAEAVSNGTVSFDQVKDKIIELNEKGLGEFPSFAKQAKNAAGGLQTGFANFNTAITRGIASVIEAVGTQEISGFVSNLGKTFETALKSVAGFIGFMIRNKDIFAPIIIAISTMIGLMTAWFVVTKTVAAGQAILNAILLANPIGLVILAIAGLVAAFMYLWKNVDGFRNFWLGAWSNISGAVTGVFNWIKGNWPLLVGILLGPIGIAVVQIIRNWETVRGWFASFWSWIRNTASSAFNFVAAGVHGLINGIRNTGNAVYSAVQSVSARIGQFFSGAGRWLYDTGRAIIQGLVNGLRDMAGAVSGAVGDIGSGIKNKFKSVLGISSPSKVFAGYGKNIVQGLVQGVESNANKAQSAAGGLLGGFNTMTPAMAMATPISLPSVDKTIASSSKVSANNQQVVVVQLNHSKGAMREAALDTINLVNEVYRAKGLPEIGVAG